MQAIGIDIGTTAISGIRMDAESGEVLCAVTRPSHAFIEGCAPWEKIQSVARVTALAEEILSSLMSEEVSVIGVTGQMHGILYFDREGRAISPLYTWQDGRGDLPSGDTTYAKRLNSYTGYGCVTDLYNRENGLRPSEAVGFCTIHDYFVMRLCGRTRPLVHATDAASLGCYDRDKNRLLYDPTLAVTADFALAGEYRGIPVAVAIGDNQASVLASVGEGDLLVNVGTGSQVSVVSERPVFAEGIETRPYFEGKHLVVGAALCGGRAYAVLKELYKEILGYARPVTEDEVYAIMAKMLDGVRDTDLVADTRFAGTRADATVTGSLTGITTENLTAGGLALAVLRGMAEELITMYQRMGVPSQAAVGSGNGIRKNPALAQVLTQMLGTPVRIPVHTEEAAFGAALFGLLSVGALSSLRDASRLLHYT